MLKFAKIFIPVLVVALGLWLLLRGWDTEVRVAEATRETAVDAETGTVEILAFADLWVRSEREGRLAEILVEAGDPVEKDQPLARQESKLLDFQIEQEEVRLWAARERMKLPLPSSFDVENMEKEIEALRLEAELGQLSQSRLEERERHLRRLRARLEEERIQRAETAAILESRVNELQFQREKAILRSPIDGKIIEIVGVEGDRIGAGASVVRVLSPHRIINMELSEEDFGGVEIGDPVTLRLASYADREFRGEVATLAPTADSQSKTRLLTVKVDADPEVLVPGLTGEGYLIKDERADTVVVPRRALIGNRVYVVNDANRVEIRTVRPGYLSLNRAEILEGVAAGERVVLENQDRLSEGEKVEIIQ